MANDEPKKYTYLVKEGKTFGALGQYPAGSEVELTEEEAAGFPDLLEAKDRKNKIKLKNELGIHVAPEYQILTGTNPQSDGAGVGKHTVSAKPVAASDVTEEMEEGGKKSRATKKKSNADNPPKGSEGGMGVG